MTAPDVIRVPATGVAVTPDVYRRRAEDTVRYVELTLSGMLYGRVLLSDLDRLSALQSASEELSKAYENLERALVMEDDAEGER